MIKAFDARREFFICLFLIVITLAVFWSVKDHDFINYDDGVYVTENTHVQAGLTLKSVAWAFTTFHAGNWHPLTWLSHMSDIHLYGLKPGGHHTTNLVLHIINALLLFLIFSRMTRALWQSAFLAAVFALHPLHVESVAWVAERKDVLSTFFWMLTIGAYAFYVERQELKRYLLVLLFYALGLMSKPMLVTLPFVLLLLDVWPLRRIKLEKLPAGNQWKSDTFVESSHKKSNHQGKVKKLEQTGKTEKPPHQRQTVFHILLEKVPFLILSAVSSIVTYVAQQKGGAVGSFQSYPLPSRVANALVSYCGYIGKMIWPDNLAVLYPHPGMLPPLQVLGAILFLVMGTFLMSRNVQRFPYLAVGWLWYVGTLVPVIGIVQVGLQGMADRYTYVPGIGVLIMVAWGVPELLKKWRYQKVALAIGAGVILSVFTFFTWKQVQYWQNSLTLFRHTLKVTSNNALIHNNMGNILENQGRIDEAIAHFNEALRINPTMADAYSNKGLALSNQGRFDEAVTNFRKAIEINPDHASAHYNIGSLLAARGNMDEGIYHFREAVRIKPDHAKGHNNLGSALLLKGKREEAITHFREALRLNPDYTMAQENLRAALSVPDEAR